MASPKGASGRHAVLNFAELRRTSPNVVIAAHATGASLALLIGAYNLVRRPKGDRQHRFLGRTWLVAMYWTVLSSFAIQALHPGHFTWIHGLSVFTFVTLSIGLWAGRTHRHALHGPFMAGSYFELVGAFIGAVVVPQHRIPQLAVHHPAVLIITVAAIALAAGVIVRLAGRRRAAFHSAVRLDDPDLLPLPDAIRRLRRALHPSDDIEDPTIRQPLTMSSMTATTRPPRHPSTAANHPSSGPWTRRRWSCRRWRIRPPAYGRPPASASSDPAPNTPPVDSSSPRSPTPTARNPRRARRWSSRPGPWPRRSAQTTCCSAIARAYT